VLVTELQIEGRVLARGDAGYEEARRASVWHGRVPDRFPELLVQAASEQDVLSAVRHAANRSMKVSVRSGGHSWNAAHLRDGGMQIDVSRLDAVTVDKESMTATAGPGRPGHELCEMLVEKRLFFPSGHCRGVALGGYLLQGGYGWNSRILGLAAESVLGVDVVTADGELRHAGPDENPELYWAARGAGSGFFGVVTRFHLRLYEMPAVLGASIYLYPMSVLDEFFTWAYEIGASVDRRVEMQALFSKAFPSVAMEDPGIMLAAPVFADSEEEATAAVDVFETCPAREKAIFTLPFMQMPISLWYDSVMTAYPSPPNRFGVDNMWTSAPVAEILPALRRMIETMPPHPSHVLWLNWGDRPQRPDMANDLEAPHYFALYGQWVDECDDDRYEGWARENMQAFAHLSSGVQLADENLGERWADFATPQTQERLARARAAYDPDGVFHSWLGQP
jgi:FAD/FMN-containing dehydrogenase